MLDILQAKSESEEMFFCNGLKAIPNQKRNAQFGCKVILLKKRNFLLSFYYTLGCKRNEIKILKTALGPLYPDSEMLI